MTNDLEVVRDWIEARFPVDEAARMKVESRTRATPLFVFARTRLGCTWRFRADLHRDVVRGLAKLAGREPAVRLPIATAPPPERLDPMMRVLERAGVTTGVVRELVEVDLKSRNLLCSGDRSSPDVEVVGDVFHFLQDGATGRGSGS